MFRFKINLIVIFFVLVFCSCEKVVYVDKIEYEYLLDTLLIDNDNASDYSVKIVSNKEGSDFHDLSEACNRLSEGKYILYLKDSLYDEKLYSDLNVKKGWIIKGRGINKTKVVFHDESPSTHNYNLNILGDSRICDVHLISVVTSHSSHYCIHMDDPSVPNLTFLCENVMMETILESSVSETNRNMLVLGIGTWDNWNLTFKNCIIKCDEKVSAMNRGFGAVNFHNNDGLAGNTVFENCKIISNGNAFLIRDVRYNYDNNERLRDRLSLKNCEIVGYIVGYNHMDGKNGFWFDFTNTSSTGLLDMKYLADSSFPCYDFNSIPQINSVRFLNNLSGERLLQGTFVNVTWGEREYYWNTQNTALMPLGFQNSETQPDGILLVDAKPGQSCHVLLHGITNISDSYVVRCQAGDYLRISGNEIVKSETPTNCVYLGERIVSFN